MNVSNIKLIVVGHGKFASGLQSSLKLFIGKQEEHNFIDFTKEMSEIDLQEKISAQVGKEETVIFTDMLGGTPYKEAAKIAYDNENVGVVSGCNLSSLLETTYKEYTSKEALMQDLVNITKETAQVFDKNDLNDESDENDFSDGI